jgi:hypothetical protein
MAYAPELLETDWCWTEVAVFCNTIVAPEITAPLGSRMTPFTEAVETWAPAEPANRRRRSPTKHGLYIPGSRATICLAKLCAELVIGRTSLIMLI